MEILTSVLKRLETKESGSDVEKINELIKVRDKDNEKGEI